MKATEMSRSRRRLFKAVLASGAAIATTKALPERWTRPVVASVLLPAHAQATTPLVNGTFSGTATATVTVVGGAVLALLVPTAAANSVTEVSVDVCLNITNSVVDAQLRIYSISLVGEALLSGSGSLGSTLTLSTLGGTLSVTGATVSADVSGSGSPRHATGSFAFTLPGHGDFMGNYDILESAMGPCSLLNCLLHGSLVVAADGKLRAIETLKPGDFVAAADPDGFEPSFAVVTRIVTHHRRDHYYRINGELLITNDHPLLVEDGGAPCWRRVDRLSIGDLLHTAGGDLEVRSIERVAQTALTVYMETSADSFVVYTGSGRYIVKGRYGVAPGQQSTPAHGERCLT
jgi:hypothetical protein